ncbi:TMEM175 family protein [Microbacterium sp. 1P10UB]|uniref:TMEM175 family protein n=1 Tax=unclassified Microbacterium TaxID=2609290 RepID=UPI0039A1FE92
MDRAGRTARGADAKTWLPSAERLKAFTDAVVAIAMTLLILPLLESVSDAGSENLTTLEWLHEEFSPIIMFVLSFVIIANFWMTHHRVFSKVERVTEALVWITMVWALTIVWLPVATAVIGQMKTDDLQRVLYIGSMALTAVLQVCTRLYLRANPRLHEISDDQLRSGILADIITTALFLVSLGVAVLVPNIGYAALFLMVLVGPIHSLSVRRLRASAAKR